MRILPLLCTLGSTWALLTIGTLRSENAEPVFRAGAVTVDITPQKFPRIIAGSFLENQASKITDPLHVRCIVLDDGKMKIAFAIVDTCMMPQSLIDEAKGMASKECGIPVDRMMVSATHTHSAPAAMGCLGTRLDKVYADLLTKKIAEGIVAASKKLEPAKIGWASVDDWEHTHNRRWIRKPGREIVDPFGQPSGRANMHPGYLSRDVIGPSGPVDPQLSVISVQTPDGKPLAVLANYSQHYFGASAVSADYYGHFCKNLAAKMGQPGDGNGPFVCAMSQGTSGDLMWMDYGAEKKNINIDTYAAEVADNAMKALKTVPYHDHVPLGMIEKTLELAYRVPDEKRLAWARPIAAKIENDVPKDKQEVYAREALILHERQQTLVKLQAIRIGDLSVATLPNEVYAITGLKLRALSPFKLHFNIELANGAEGYIPPIEQHALGGYTTWPARTAGLEEHAETKMYAELWDQLSKLSGTPRRTFRHENGAYADVVLQSQSTHYFRLEEFSECRQSEVGSKQCYLRTASGYGNFLPGPGSGRGYADESALTPSPFSGSQAINRSVHLAGGYLHASWKGNLAERTADGRALQTEIPSTATIALWFWLGHESGASDREGELINALGVSLKAKQDAQHRVRLTLGKEESKEELLADDWHFAVLVRDGENVRVHIDGAEKPSMEGKADAAAQEVFFGRGLEGRLDEIAMWKRAIEPSLIAKLWDISKVGETNARHLLERKQKEQDAVKQDQAAAPQQGASITFAKDYESVVSSLKPRFGMLMPRVGAKDEPPGIPAGLVNPYARVVPTPDVMLGSKWSVSIWFRNDTPNDVRAVAAYLVSRGPRGNAEAPGDHLGIGGNYRGTYTGKLIVFNGNEANQIASGSTTIAPGTWNHVVFVRDGARVRAWLNGADKPEIDADLTVTAANVSTLFLGHRCDNFAPLSGSVAQFALFDRALTADEAKKLHAGANPVVSPPETASAALPAKPQLASPPLSPEESAKKWHVREGYKIELVAAEPLVLDPVAFDWDAQGRLWVVEMADYPLGMDGKGRSGGRVVMLEDTNGDAKYDKRTVITDGLNFPTGILTWRDGAIVTAAPDVLYVGPTGEKKVLLTGFSTGNQQLRVNGLRWGMDGWVYCAAGAHNAGYNKGTEITSVLTGEKLALGSRDFRFKPDTGEFDPQSGPSQFGRARDDWGHWFGVQNSFPLWHYVLQDHYLRRNPHVIPPDPIHQLFPRNPKVYPVSSMEKRFHSFGESGRFTSACGIEVYRDRVLFDDGKTHAFTCEPFHNVVQHHVLEEDGVSFKATRDPAETKHDFLASEDRWCRPVMVRTGPDGALWVADMYRYMIEHPQWLPQNGKDELLPHYREGDDKGRIWRVVREGGGRAGTAVREAVAMFNEADKSVRAPLRAPFESANGWVRDKAQMLMATGELEPIESLAGLSGLGRVQAAWTLVETGGLKLGACLDLMTHESPRVREQALQMAERFDWEEGDSDPLKKALTQLANDPDEKVRLQLACSLASFPGEAAAEALAKLLNEAPAGSPVAGAAMSSVMSHLTAVCRRFPEGGEPKNNGAIRSLFRCALSVGNDEAISALMPAFESRLHLPEMLAVLDERDRSLSQFAGSIKDPAAQKSLKRAQELVTQAAEEVRKAGNKPPLYALELLANDRAHREEAALKLGDLWKNTSPELAPTLLPFIGRLQPKNAPELLLAGWSERTPSLRSQIVETLLSNDAWTLTLLERIQSKQVEANACDAATRARLVKHPKAEVKKLASAVFADAGSSARAAVLEKFRPALALKGDAANGKTLFAQICISCHKLDGVGLELGPDLRSVAQHDGEKLLNSILDPSAIIEPGFMAYHCTLKNGEQLYGVIATETSTSLTLKLPGNVTKAVLRSDIASLKSTNTSLMPDGLEAVMTPQSMADLIAYLKMARQ
jgi:putative membrane-bound dehydrogenase-like protein